MKGNPFLILSLILLPLAVCCMGEGTSEIEGVQWSLDSYQSQEGVLTRLIPNTEITVQFQDGEIRGSAGCNSYGGAYSINGSAITIGSLFSTEMFCIEPEGIMEQEGDYLAALGSVTGFQINGSRMEMTDADEIVVLVFAMA